MLMSADDTTLYCNLKGANSEVTINNELSKFTERLTSNNLSLNIKKIKLMSFHTKQRRVGYPVLKLNNVNIERVSQFNFHGVVINSRLKWDKYIAHNISLIILKATDVLFRLRLLYHRKILLTLYNALILPHLIYCILVGCSKIKNNHSLLLLQKRLLEI